MRFIIFSILLFSFCQIYAQPISYSGKIDWQDKIAVTDPTARVPVIYFNGCSYPDESSMLPYYHIRMPLPENTDISSVDFSSTQFAPVNQSDISGVNSINSVGNRININYSVQYERKRPYLELSFIPLKYNESKNLYEKLTDFTLNINVSKGSISIRSTHSYAANSILASGKWLKVKIVSDGIYRITYDQLNAYNVTDPAGVRVFGNGGGMLPSSTGEDFPDDLEECAIWIEKGGDGIFNSGDYILFYGQAPVRWKYDTINNIFIHQLHYFSDATYYFITKGSPKTIMSVNSSANPTTNTVTSFNDYAFHESEDYNLLKSGNKWFGELFDIDLEYTFSFNFSNISTSVPVSVRSSLVARAAQASTFTVKNNSQTIQTVTMPAINPSNYTADYASQVIQINTFSVSSGSVPVTVKYSKPLNVEDAQGWLDYIELNVRRNLSMANGQVIFRDINSVGAGNTADFQLSGAGSNTKVWEVTDHNEVTLVNASYASGTLSFKANTDSLREFIAWDGSSFLSPAIIGEVTNQNLHGMLHKDLIIISHPNFLSSAYELAAFHAENDKITVSVVTPEQVYNEFSCGSPDVSAIRNFMRMFYDRATTDDEMPRYLLFFGDGSYDNNTIDASNTNYILTYQSDQSLKPTSSYVTDDFFGLLDSWDDINNGSLDIGIGRLPVKTTTEADDILDKIYHYYNASTMGDWRNSICFIGDDEDSNQHMTQANNLATKVDTAYPVYNIQKIYLDAYKQESTPAGERYPEVNRAIKERVEKGALIVNYTGHGNELGLAHENILDVSDINSWENYDNMPVFITATCEFGRFDDYERTSAGELIFLNPDGGGIALLTTTRLVYSSPNYNLNRAFYDFAFEKNADDEYYRMGDLMRLTKNNAGTGTNKRNFTLLGDPALRMAIPEMQVITLKINDVDITSTPDTLKALSKVTISGYIADNNGQKLSNYDGILYPTVFDKKDSITSLSNDGFAKFIFYMQNNVLYKGKASIKQGDFSFSFIVPKDISYRVGFGKISYYAENKDQAVSDYIDAHGYHNNIIIGGSNDNAPADNAGPVIDLYLNDTMFVYGGITDENPLLLAKVFDDNGINTVGNGIGHDIVATLDESTTNQYILNDFYESDLDSYQKGSIEYNLYDLEEGLHRLNLKVWDVYNNSSDETIEFIVAESSELVLDHIFNYPNPFTTNTSFYFDHNQPNSDLDVLIQVFTVSGKLVKTISTTITSNGYRSDPIHWDGLD
ncbi:MAG: type IX secretion system sortase PorU, partial [Bacteroidota bacterium]